MPHKILISQYLDTVGDGSGTKNAIGDYATTATVLKIAPGTGAIYDIHRLIFSISDTGAMTTAKYGTLNALTAGIEIYVADEAGINYYLTDPDFPIKTNGELSYICFDVDYVTLGGGDTLVNGRFSFDRFTEGPDNRDHGIVLHGKHGEHLGVAINDTLTGLNAHRFLVQGHVLGGVLNG